MCQFSAQTDEYYGIGGIVVTPLREFLNVNDLSKAILFAIENKMNYHLYNIGSGEEISIISSKIDQILSV